MAAAAAAMTAAKKEMCKFNTLQQSDFEIGQRIGKGQFSVVYRARCKKNNKMVALKKVQIFEMTDVKARVDCMQEIQLLQVTTSSYSNVACSGTDCHVICVVCEAIESSERGLLHIVVRGAQ